MKTIPDNVAKRLLFILHRGLTEVRNLGLGEGNEHIADLADALEILPRYVQECGEEDVELIRFVLKNYQDKYPHSNYDYLAYFDKYEPPERY
ncbi:MAG TPA: hypothetical protein VG013_17930 [Gemmataceae bacterium]|jgi:hypothetical protein|nr:hypothetical protein [Gemmataceae bacterium]